MLKVKPATPGAASSRSERPSFLQLFVVFALLFAYPLLAMLWYHQYPLLSMEVGSLLFAIIAAAILVSKLMLHTGPLVTNLAIVLGLTVVSLIQFNLLFLGMLAVVTAGSMLALLLRRNFRLLASAVLAAMLAGAWLDNLLEPSTRLHELTQAAGKPDKGPVIHILMDGFIGPDGLPEDGESQQLRSEILSFFQDYNFTLYTRAYSHYATTADSMARAFNFRNDNQNIFQRSVLMRQAISFKENAWFAALEKSGYAIVVYQSESMDFCSATLSQEVACNVLPMPNLATLNRDLEAPLTRAWVLFQNMLGQSAVISMTLKDLGIMQLGTWGVSVYDERLMQRLSDDIKLRPGNAFFAHVLIPHAPLIYREDCSIDYGSEPWTRYPHSGGDISNTLESKAVRQAKIAPQVRCGLKILGTLFEDLKAQGLYDQASIIVHADHGTSAFRTRPSAITMDKLTRDDLKEAFSTLYAVKLPGGSFNLNHEIISLNVLLAQTATEITGMSAEELGAEVTDEEEVFVYLADAFPLMRVYVNPFVDQTQPDIAPEDSQVGE